MFCQGDFLPGQVLCDPGGWSVIDFDDSRYADPLSDVAAMYAAMPRELGLSGERAEHARRTYLEAYADRAGEVLDRGRWLWFLALLQLTRARQAADGGTRRPRRGRRGDGPDRGGRARVSPARQIWSFWVMSTAA